MHEPTAVCVLLETLNPQNSKISRRGHLTPTLIVEKGKDFKERTKNKGQRITTGKKRKTKNEGEIVII